MNERGECETPDEPITLAGLDLREPHVICIQIPSTLAEAGAVFRAVSMMMRDWERHGWDPIVTMTTGDY